MCGGRIWGAIAGLIGAFATYFIIEYFGFNVDPENAKLIAFFVGLGIFLLPNLLTRSSSATMPANSISVTKKKEDWEEIIRIIELDCRSKGEKWIQWGDSLKGIIQASTNRISSPDKNVTITIHEENWKTINSILEKNRNSQ